MKELFVGAGRALLDPPKDMYPMPTRFCIADDIYDSCYLRVIAIKSGQEQLLMLIYELSDYPTVENLTDEIVKASGFPKDSIMITFTHNHTSPCDEANLHFSGGDESEEISLKREKFKEIELEATINAVKQAVGSMRRAKAGFGTIDSFVNVNRDYETFGGYWIEAPNHAGFSDKTLSVVKFVDDNDKLIAAFLNHGTHSTCAFLQNDADGKNKTSGNFSGIACKFAEKYYGDDAVIAWAAGAAGNQNPIMSHGLLYEYEDGYATMVPVPDGVGYMQMESVGRTHGADAIKCISSIESYNSDISIKKISKTVSLPTQKRVALPGGKKVNVRMGGEGMRDWDKVPYGQAPRVPDVTNLLEPDPENPKAMQLKLIVLGDVALVFTNGELYSELGSLIKEVSPAKNTVVTTYSIEKSTGYILDKTAVGSKVFQAFSSVVPGAADDILKDAIAEMFNTIDQ